MAFKRMTGELGFISRLPDEPNETLGMSAQSLKAEFDRAGEALRDYINNQLLPAIEGQEAAAALGMSAIDGLTGAKNIQAALEALETQIKDAVLGSLPELSVGAGKLARGAVTGEKIASGAVSGDKIAQGAVDEFKLRDKAVSSGKLCDDSVTETKIRDGAVSRKKLADGAVSCEKIADFALTAPKIAPGAVDGSKLAAGSVSTLYSLSLAPGDWSSGSDGEIFALLSVPGLSADSALIADLDCSGLSGEALETALGCWGSVLRCSGAEGKISIYIQEKPEITLPIKLLEVKK